MYWPFNSPFDLLRDRPPRCLAIHLAASVAYFTHRVIGFRDGNLYLIGPAQVLPGGLDEDIERQLRAKGHKAEVYQFGMDGAPLSQYLHVLRREVVKYQPDIVVVPLTHNDFDESYRFLKTRYASSFMKLQ